MPGQKRKYNVRFPPGRIKKIMQKDTEVGRMATAVPVIISKALEMFLISFLTKTSSITQSKHSRVMSINHMKQCIETEKLFDFLKDLAEQACGAATSKEDKAKGKCPGHRRKWNTSLKPKSPEREELPKRTTTTTTSTTNTEPIIHSDSSSESELVICLETQSP
ncbi:dr1-associated corepressor isoform X1 [Hoplias malabaricus]|uniref:dr1-associated corepressor isoform X1 n=1 Tax=Hoplias malabaricus TaxID=27720 RepID=UPI003462D75C